MNLMERYTFDPNFDPSDHFDMEREWEVPNTDYTADLPPIPGTTDLHPIDCPCLPCQANREEMEWEGPTCNICDGVGHGYPGAGPCPLEERGYDDGPGYEWER